MDEMKMVIRKICNTFDEGVYGLVRDKSIGLDKFKEKVERMRLFQLKRCDKATANQGSMVQERTRSELDKKLRERVQEGIRLKEMQMEGSALKQLKEERRQSDVALATAKKLNQHTQRLVEEMNEPRIGAALIRGAGGALVGAVVRNEANALYDPDREGVVEGMVDAFSDPAPEGFLEGIVDFVSSIFS